LEHKIKGKKGLVN